ncbi:hypothetical protein EDD18DRAFT_1273836 [Armillaria luteobubalina]|uniref:TPR-like protein n=1 Tax=Armillaria luteobubalina TaxID=153913 RepID=A0AA39QPK1_9AGAR|nr:hypothetical protein EDD18DRAFT_1273836 [Armillaria luteobubalina]
MQAPSQTLTQSSSAAAPDRSAILAPPNLAPDDTDWISTASLTFRVLAGAGELDPSNIAKAIANIALPILELVQNNKKARNEVKDTIQYLDEMLHSVSEEIKLLQEGGSPTDTSTRPLMRLQQMGDEFVSQLEVLKDDLNKIYGKTGLREKIKKTFQSKAILDHINQHKVYVKDARDKLVATAVLSTARQVGKIVDVDAKVTDIHNHLMSPSRIQPVNSIMLSSIPPPAPSVFLGRDDLVQEGITNLLADSPCSIVIMGFGGMGKTSLALKILNDEAVQAKYEAHRYFIPCDIICSVDSTVEILLQAVMKLMNLDLAGDAVKQLHTIPKPTILVFDNFETVWDQSSDQYSIQLLLAQLNFVAQITLMITMRGSVAPIEDVNWLILPYNGLSPVNELISLDIFSAISRHTVDEEAVKELVKELEGWPLAITLMAFQAKILSPKTLLKSWYQEKTSLLQRPRAQAHRLSSVDISIKITLQSSLLSSKPDTLKLLSVICYLPNGIPTWECLIHKMLPNVPEQTLIISQLLQSGIIYQDDKEGLKLLSPIQEYLKTYSPSPDTDIKNQICLFYINEIDDNSLLHYSGDKTKFKVSHSKNIEWISHMILDDKISKKHLTTIYNFCYFQYLSWDSDRLLKNMLFVIKQTKMQDLYSFAILLLGYRYIQTSQYKLAKEHVYQAMQSFEYIEDTLGIAKCLQSLGNILQLTNQYFKATANLEKAMQMFEDNTDTLGAAQCLRSLGDILYMTDQYSKATVNLEKAMQMFENIDDTLGAAQCLQSLGNILYITDQYSKATVNLVKAMQMFKNIGNTLGAAQCLQSLGKILYITNQYSEATVNLEKAMQMFENIGDTLGAAWCLQSLGKILYITNEYSEATVNLEKAMQMFENIGNTHGAAQCLQSLGDILYITNEYSEATVKLEKAMQMFENIGNTHGAAQCLQSLGNILCMTNEYSEATVNLEKAMQMFENIGNTHGAAQCLQSLEDILYMTNQYSKATVSLEKAMQMFENIGDTLGAAQGLPSLGNILQMTDQYSEATVNLEKAI